MFDIITLPHTADTRLILEADTVGELFHAGLDAMNKVMFEDGCKKAREFPETRTIETRSIDTTGLLIDFLSDVLTASHEEKVLYCKLRIRELSEKHIIADLNGTKVDGFEEDIKAVTYHEADVHRDEKGKWCTVLIFDI